MQCIVIGISPISSQREEGVLKNKLTEQLTGVDGSLITWVSNSVAVEEGIHTQLFSCITDANVDEVVTAVKDTLPREYTCELWGSAPAILPLRPPEGYNHHLFCGDTMLFDHWACVTMKEWGMFVQNGILLSDELVLLRQTVLNEIDKTERLLKMHHPDISIGQDIISFKEIASRGNERFDLLLPPSSTACQFVSDVIKPRISHVLDNILGNDIDCDVSVVYSRPRATNQGWHADGDHQRGANDAGMEVDGWRTSLSEPYALCIFIPLIDLDDITGFTQFWPASHRNKGLAGFGPFAEIAEATFDGKCKAGSAIWYDYRLMHRGIENTSTILRPVLQLLFRRTWYIEKRNYGNISMISKTAMP